MANFAGTYLATYKSPQFYYDVSWKETARASGSATFQVTVGVRMGSTTSSFGFPLDMRITIGNVSTGLQRIKGTETWTGNGTRSFTYTLTPTGVGDSGGTISAKLEVLRVSGYDGNSAKIDTGGDETVTASVWNTAPSIPAGWTFKEGSSSGATPGSVFPENVSNMYVVWNKATDKEGGTITYTLQKELNKNGSWTSSYTGTNTYYTDSVSNGQGTIFRWRVRCQDSGGLLSDWVYSDYYTKNTFTKGTISTTTTSIGYRSSNLTIPLTIGAGTNTNTNGTFTYTLSSSNVTINNATTSSGAINLIIYVSGTTPTTPYIKWTDLVNAYASGSYKGTLGITLKTANAYGSSGTGSISITINLQTNPSSFSITGVTGTYTIGGATYYIPDRKAITVTWGASTDLLKSSNAIKYDIYYSYNSNNDYVLWKNNLTGTSTSGTLPVVTSATTVYFKVYSKTIYGTSTSVTSSAYTFHYYNPPYIVFNNVTRTETGATVSGTVFKDTSITAITTNTSATFTTTGGLATASTSITLSSGAFTRSFSNLTGNQSFTFTISGVQDTGSTPVGVSNVSASISIPAYTPALTIRNTGVGINAIPDSTYPFRVGSDSGFDEDMYAMKNFTTYGDIIFDKELASQAIRFNGQGQGAYNVAFICGDDNGNQSRIFGIRDDSIGKDIIHYDYDEFLYLSSPTKVQGNVTINGTLSASSKSAVTNTLSHGTVITYCDESPNHVFTDRFKGTMDKNGYCYIFFDDVMKELVNYENLNYWTTITPIGEGVVANLIEEGSDYILVKGTPNGTFNAVVSAERLGTEHLRFNDANNLFEPCEEEVYYQKLNESK